MSRIPNVVGGLRRFMAIYTGIAIDEPTYAISSCTLDSGDTNKRADCLKDRQRLDRNPYKLTIHW